MNNPVLLSESFERAAYAHARAMESFGAGDFELAVDRFRQSVDKLQLLLGMQAENDCCKAVNETPVYDEKAFLSIQ